MRELNLCSLRDIYRVIRNFEMNFQQDHGLCLNEGMLLCSLGNSRYTSTEIAGILGLSCSNASKVIRSVEGKGYVKRSLGEDDRRQMYFSVTEPGLAKLEKIKQEDTTIAIVLKNIKDQYLRIESVE